ncbi:MAG: 4'-phosphopantetheinyl transferase family protein [Caulobacterales bacterium]
MIRWVLDLGEVAGLEHGWAWPVRLDGPQASRALAGCRPSGDDLADAARLTNSAAGARRLLRRRLLRALAARALGAATDRVSIARDERGGVRVTTPGPAFASIAARGDWALLAVGPTALGVDIELTPEPPPPADLLHPREQALLAACPGPSRTERTWRIWVAKEAFAKASGWPLDRALAEIAPASSPGVEVSEYMLSGVVMAAVSLESDFAPA